MEWLRREIEELRVIAAEDEELAARFPDGFMRSYLEGKADAYLMASIWLEKAIKFNLPPDPEDEEGTGLEPEEVAEEGKPQVNCLKGETQ